MASSRGGKVTAIAAAERTLGQAVDAFLARQLGRDRPLATVTDDELAEAVEGLWGERAPRTWNRHVATIRSLLSWCPRYGWPVGDLQLRVDRRAVADDDSKALPLPELERLWGRADVPLHARALWLLLYDSAARVEEALGLDVEDLDLANRQARARTNGATPARYTSRPPPPGCSPSSPAAATAGRCL
jgi:integrase